MLVHCRARYGIVDVSWKQVKHVQCIEHERVCGCTRRCPQVYRTAITASTQTNKKAELMPELARERAATWRLIVDLDSPAAIESLICANVLPLGESVRTPASFHQPTLDSPAQGDPVGISG